MINQITNVNNNPFQDFKTSQNTKNYYLLPKDNPDEFVSLEKEEKHTRLVFKIALTTLGVGFGTLALMKGLPKNTVKNLSKLKEFLHEKFQNVSSELKTDKLNDKYEKAQEKVNKLINKSQSLNNLGWFKDVLFLKLMGLNKYTKNLHSKITEKFDKISLKTVDNAYKLSEETFSGLFNMYDESAIIRMAKAKGLDATEILQKIAEKRKNIQATLNSNFGASSRNERHQRMKDSMVNLVDDFWKNLRSQKSYKSSIAEELLVDSKNTLSKPLYTARENIAGAGNKLSSGELKELLDLYKKILPESEFVKLEAQAKKSIETLDKAIDTDAVEYFDKYRDLVLGCAPTDTLSVIASLGSVGLGLSTAEDKNERYSVLLNVGLPIVGSVATTLYFTARLVSGFKALGLGLLSGFVFGQAGSVVDNLRQKHLQPKTLIAQQSTKESI